MKILITANTNTGHRDPYKVDILNKILHGMDNDEYYLPRLKGDDTKAIYLDREAIELLIDYYS